jgi:arabinofuranan 3-O-arabinosyltransferase
MISLPPTYRAWPGRAVSFLLRRGVRRALAWLVVVACTIVAVDYAWICYDKPTRRDGNYGHATIDFGGQWLMGRMLVTGNGQRLYDRIAQRRVLEEAYPRADSEDPRLTEQISGFLAPLAGSDPLNVAVLEVAGPEPDVGDSQRLLGWMMGEDNPEAAALIGGYLAPLAARDPVGATAVLLAGREHFRPVDPQLGGPLYPPINSYLYAPLGMLPPRAAYRLMQTLNLVLTFAIAVLAQRITGGRVWWQVAVPILMVFPGYSGALNLGQNSLISLFVLMLGWRQLQQGRLGRAGMAWGLLAFKPVWAVAFFLVPLLTRRWRMAATMAATGAVLAVATLPVVGWHSWQEWLSIGSLATVDYACCETWIFLSRDLIGVPRRYLLTFSHDFAVADDPGAGRATALGLGLWMLPLAVTIAATIRRGRSAARVTAGPQAAFVLFGAWMACYHFMYYDVVLAYLPCCLLHAEPRRLWRRSTGGLPPGTWRGLARAAVTTALLISLSLFAYLGTVWDSEYHFPPWDTLCIALLWLWCDLAWGQGSVRAMQLGESGPGVGGPHERLSDEDGTNASREQRDDVSPATDAALTHQADASRDGGGDFERVL